MLDLSALDDDSSPAGEKVETIVVKSETAPTAPLSDFIEDPNNPRTEFDEDSPEWAEFCADIEARGILQPIIVTKLDDGKLLIRFGHRRYRGAKKIGLAVAPYVVTEDVRQLDDYAQFSENNRRKGMQPLETALFIQKKIEGGETKAKVAENLSIDPSAVTHLLSLVNAPDFLMELYQTRKCRAPHYLYELRKLHSKNPEIVERRCAEAEEIDRKLLVAIADEVNPKAPPPVQPTNSVEGVMDKLPSEPGTNSGTTPAADHAQGGEVVQGEAVGSNSTKGENTGEGEEKNKTEPDPSKIKKPLLFAQYDNREVTIVLNKRPSTPGLIFIRYEDGSGDEEVVIGDVKLTGLTDSNV